MKEQKPLETDTAVTDSSAHNTVPKKRHDSTNILNDGGQASLLCAAKAGVQKVVKSLLKRDNIQINTRDQTGLTPLSWSARNGRKRVVQLLLKEDDIEINSQDQDGRTPLSWAAANGHKAVVKLLLEQDNIEINIKDKSGRTALSHTAQYGHTAVALLLLMQSNIQIDEQDRDGWSPLAYAAENKHEKTTELLAQKSSLQAGLQMYGLGWSAIYNKQAEHSLTITLQQSLPHRSIVCCVCFSDDGQYFATGCNNSSQIFQLPSGKLISSVKEQLSNQDGDSYIRSVCFTPNGKYLVAGSEDKRIRVCLFVSCSVCQADDLQVSETLSGTIDQYLDGHEADVYSVECASNNRLVASGAGDKTVRLWDLERGTMCHKFVINDGVTSVTISHDGRLIAGSSLDSTIYLWDTNSGYLVQRLGGINGHRDTVYSVCFIPHKDILVSTSLDGTMKMWELPMFNSRGIQQLPKSARKEKCIRTMIGHKVFYLTFSLKAYSFTTYVLIRETYLIVFNLGLRSMCKGFSRWYMDCQWIQG